MTDSMTAPKSASLGSQASRRMPSLDFVRGVAMILMAIDHVRVYSGIPAGGPTFGVFFTRWITNFVAPTFVFLAGTSAYLLGRRLRQTSSLSKYLAMRGVWLIVLELTVLRVFWTFNFDFRHYLLAGVIWMIGWCMLSLSVAVFIPVRLIAIVGALIIVLHNIADIFQAHLSHSFTSEPNWILRILYFGGSISLAETGPHLYILYALIPWIGLMFLGYAFGRFLENSPHSRSPVFLKIGSGLTALFVILRLANIYGDPRGWDGHSLFSFLNTTKYPASLEYLLMTLGPMFLLWAFAERDTGRFAKAIATFGQVPLFYYLLHIPLIHLAACTVSFLREGHIDTWLLSNQPVRPGPVPLGYTWSLSLLYLVFAVCVIALYFPCRWYARLKLAHSTVWARFL